MYTFELLKVEKNIHMYVTLYYIIFKVREERKDVTSQEGNITVVEWRDNELQTDGT